MVIALILSGGTGSRLGADIPKQYIEVAGKPIISYCVETLSRHEGIDGLWIVADDKWQGFIRDSLAASDINRKFRGFSKPGQNRQLSIYNGLCDLEGLLDARDYVLVHDAARPFLSGDMITQCIGACTNHDGVLPVLPMKDTVYLSRDGRSVSSLLRREEVYAGQAPEMFVYGKYLEANKKLLPSDIFKINGSTEPAVLNGMDIAMIGGDEGNFKITTREDLERMQEAFRKK